MGIGLNWLFNSRRALTRVLCLSAAGLIGASRDFHVAQPCVQGAARAETRIVETWLASVPALMRIPAKITKPPILLWHGFGPPASERALMQVLPLDEVPAVKIYLGLPQFGARELPGGPDDLVRRQAEDLGRLLFEPVVVGAAQELPSVITALRELHCIQPEDRVGLFGFSAGGAAALFALAEGKAPIGAAVVVNASTGLTASVEAYERATKKPYAWTDYTRGLALRTSAVQRAADIARAGPALMILHGTEDDMLNAQTVLALRNALVPFYRTAGNEQRLRLTLIDGLSHNWADSARASELRQTIAKWFDDW